MLTAKNPIAFGAGIAALFIVYGILVIGSLVMPVVDLVDIVRQPDWQWRLAGQEKVLWIVLGVLINFLATPSLIYRFSIRKKLVVVDR